MRPGTLYSEPISGNLAHHSDMFAYKEANCSAGLSRLALNY